MAKLDPDRARLIWEFQAQLLDIIDRARTLELWLLDYVGETYVGETVATTSQLEDLQNIAMEATDRFSRFSTIQLRIANSPTPATLDIIELVDRTIETTQQKIPALQRSTQEIEQEWKQP